MSTETIAATSTKNELMQYICNDFHEVTMNNSQMDTFHIFSRIETDMDFVEILLRKLNKCKYNPIKKRVSLWQC